MLILKGMAYVPPSNPSEPSQPTQPGSSSLLDLQYISGKYINIQGNEVAFGNFASTDYVSIPSGASQLSGTLTHYSEQKLVSIFCFYDSNKSFISYVDELTQVEGESVKADSDIVLGGWGSVVASIPANAKYVRVTYILDLGGTTPTPDQYKTPKIYYK